MDLHQLRCFIAVAEELNFGRAAARLHMTQPPLSRQIQLLEKSLGGALFERNNRHVQLTHMGQHLLTESRLILKLADRLESSVQQCASGEIGTLSMGFTAVFAWSFIPQLLKALSVKLPGVDFRLFEQVSHKQISSVENNSIDVGFVRHVPPNPLLAYQPLQGRRLSPRFIAITRWHASARSRSALLTMSPFSFTARMKRATFTTVLPTCSSLTTSRRILSISLPRPIRSSEW
jgi:DNA-binding transcriptional LysR family regulator